MEQWSNLADSYNPLIKGSNPFPATKPKWRNGRRMGLKIPRNFSVPVRVRLWVPVKKMNQESKEISTNKLNFKQIIPDYRLVFPCPHCGQEINDSHFSQEKKAFNYLNEQAKELIEKHFLAQESQYQKKWLENLEISRAYENIAPVKSLRETLQRKEVEIAHLQSSEYIEKLERVKNLVSENQELRKEKDILSRQSRSVKRKGELFEQFVVEELHRVFDGQDKISKLTQLGEKADFLQEVLTSSEPRKVAGRIVYEVKDAEN